MCRRRNVFETTKAHRGLGIQWTALALTVYASQCGLHRPTQDSLPAAGQALPGGIGYPLRAPRSPMKPASFIARSPNSYTATVVGYRPEDHASRRLAADFGLPVEFVQGSFIPAGDRLLMRAAGSFAWLTTTEAPAHEALGLATEDFGIIFAYPWPDEERALGQLFERHAGPGALLVTHHGGEDFRLLRKSG